MRGPYHHPHRGEDREIRLTRHESFSALRRNNPWAADRFAAMGSRFDAKPLLQPADLDTLRNPLRPTSLDDMVGQEKLKPLLRRLIENAKTSGRPLDHLLLVGASGTGKSTTAMVVARELGARVFMLKAPVDGATLEALSESARDGDVVFVDEIHMMVSGDRRGISQACDPESFYALLEDGVLSTASGPVEFPHVTWIGATTDVGLLPEPLTNRFPLNPRLAPYTTSEMVEIARRNLEAMHRTSDAAVPDLFANACRLNPRQVNSYVRAAAALGGDYIDSKTAIEVVTDLSGTTLDGLTPSMQTVLRYLYQHCGRETKDGVVYSASVNNLATAAGHGRDTKAINLLVEPWLLQEGLIQVRPGTGRVLTKRGVERAKQL